MYCASFEHLGYLTAIRHYIKNTLDKLFWPEDTDSGTYVALRVVLNTLTSEDEADGMGNDSLPEVVYIRIRNVLESSDGLDQNHKRTLLLKMTSFYERIGDQPEAEKILKDLSKQKSATVIPNQQELCEMLAKSIQRTSDKMSDAFKNQDLGYSRLNVTTPFPPIQRAVLHGDPEVVSMLFSDANNVSDILYQQVIHVTAEANIGDLFNPVGFEHRRSCSMPRFMERRRQSWLY
jgi:hypothetical protein